MAAEEFISIKKQKKTIYLKALHFDRQRTVDTGLGERVTWRISSNSYRDDTVMSKGSARFHIIKTI